MSCGAKFFAADAVTNHLWHKNILDAVNSAVARGMGTHLTGKPREEQGCLWVSSVRWTLVARAWLSPPNFASGKVQNCTLARAEEITGICRECPIPQLETVETTTDWHPPKVLFKQSCPNTQGRFVCLAVWTSGLISRPFVYFCDFHHIRCHWSTYHCIKAKICSAMS